MAINPPPDMSSMGGGMGGGLMGSLMGGGLNASANSTAQTNFKPRSFDLVHMPCLPMEVMSDPAFFRRHILKYNESLSSSSFMIG